MPDVLGFDHRLIAAGTIAIGLGLTACAAYRLGRGQRPDRRHTRQFYEEQKALNEYLLFHYGTAEEILPYSGGPKDSLNFPRTCAELCRKHFQGTKAGTPSRALDIGCAVGGAAFELGRTFEEVVGLDYSHSFIRACQQLRRDGAMNYSITTEGELTRSLTARVNPSVDRTRVVFQRGDACALPPRLGTFDCVLAANLICRLHTPRDFLAHLADVVTPGGVLVITTPYTFLTEYTPRENWVGGYETSDGRQLTGFDGLCQCLQPAFELLEQQDVPFLIRETARKNQWTVSHATVWRRRSNNDTVRTV